MIRLSTILLASTIVHLVLVMTALWGPWEVEGSSLEAISVYVTHAERVAPVKVMMVPAQVASTVAPKAPAPAPAPEEPPKGAAEPEPVAAKREEPRPPEVKQPEPEPEAEPEAKKVPALKVEDSEVVKAPPEEVLHEPRAVVSLPEGEAPSQDRVIVPVTEAASRETGTGGLRKSGTGVGGQAPKASEAGLGGGVDRAGLYKAYRKKVFLAVNRRKSIPRAARRARMTGTVYVVVMVDGGGKILSARVRKSSGHKLLDETALATVLGIGVMPRPPEALGWTQKELTIPIRYTT